MWSSAALSSPPEPGRSRADRRTAARRLRLRDSTHPFRSTSMNTTSLSLSRREPLAAALGIALCLAFGNAAIAGETCDLATAGEDGGGATAGGDNAIACGNGAEASGERSTAIGAGSLATAQNATALGERSEALAMASSAIGAGRSAALF